MNREERWNKLGNSTFLTNCKALSRFRVNFYKDKGNYAAAFRTITSIVPSFDKLGLPEVVRKMSDKPRGLILVTGPTGSGKSTTLAAMIDYINTNRAEHILRLKTQSNLFHTSKQSIIHQRELAWIQIICKRIEISSS